MAEKRMLSKVISVSKKVNLRLTNHFSRLFYTWIIPHTDDFGRLTGCPHKLRALIIPMLSETHEDVEKALMELHNADLIKWYEVNGEQYLQVTNFEEHQQGLHKRTKSKVPDPPDFSRKFPEIPSELKGTEGNRTEGKGRETEILPLINLHKVRYDKHENIELVESYINLMDFEVIEDAIIRSKDKDHRYLLKTLGNIYRDGKTSKESIVQRFVSPTEQEAINAQRKAEELKNHSPLNYDPEFVEVEHATAGPK
jgi:hypothetical protein